MKKCIIFIVITVLFANLLPAFADKWKLVHKSPDGHSLCYMAPGSIKKVGVPKTIEVAAQSVTYSKTGGKLKGTDLYILTCDCVKKVVRVKQKVDYDAKGNIKSQKTYDGTSKVKFGKDHPFQLVRQAACSMVGG